MGGGCMQGCQQGEGADLAGGGDCIGRGGVSACGWGGSDGCTAGCRIANCIKIMTFCGIKARDIRFWTP
jgi:hypothetical protein